MLSPFLTILGVELSTNASLAAAEEKVREDKNGFVNLLAEENKKNNFVDAENENNLDKKIVGKISLQALNSLPINPVQENVLPVKAAPGQKVEGRIRAIASKPSTKAGVDFFVRSQAIEEPPTRTTLFLKITDSNKFTSKTTPTAVILGAEEKITVNVKDSFGKPVPDALVSFFECGGAPLAGEEISVQGDGQRSSGRNGEYFAKLTPSALGKIGVRVEHPEFTPYEECSVSVLPGQFLKAEPDALLFEGNSVPRQLRKITVTSTQELESKTDAVARCADANGNLLSTTLLSVSPPSFTLRSSKELVVSLQEGASASTNCFIGVNARAGTFGSFLEIPVSVNVQAPPAPPNVPYPPITAQVAMRVDDSGVSQAFFDAGQFGQITGCRLIPTGSAPVPQDFVRVACAGNTLQVSTEYDFSQQGVCIPPQGNTGKILVSRTIQGFPVPDAAIGLVVLAGKTSSKECVPPSPSPSATATLTPTPTVIITPEHCRNGLQDQNEQGLDCGGSGGLT